MADEKKQTLRGLIRFFDILVPSANAAVALANYDPSGNRGKMSVAVEPTASSVEHVLVKTIPYGQQPPQDPPGGEVELPKVSSSRYATDDYWVEGVAQTDGFKKNKTLCYWGKNGGGTVVERRFLAFTAVPNPCLGSVSGKHCIWLTYAPTGQTLPHGETTNEADGYLPWGVRVPINATSVRVEAVSGSWGHEAANMTGAIGRTGTGQNLSFRWEYKNATLSSESILDAADTTGTPLDLNRLVGLWEYEEYFTAPTTEIDIGPDSGTVTIPTTDARPLRLRLGMHDGFEWSNNVGSLGVRVTWS